MLAESVFTKHLDEYLARGEPQFHQHLAEAYRLANICKQDAIEYRIDPDEDPGYCQARSLLASGRQGRLNITQLARLQKGLA